MKRARGSGSARRSAISPFPFVSPGTRMIIRDRLAAELEAAVERARAAGSLTLEEVPPIQLDDTPSPELGDFSSDLPLVLSRLTRQSAPAVAEALAAQVNAPAGLLERVEVGRS